MNNRERTPRRTLTRVARLLAGVLFPLLFALTLIPVRILGKRHERETRERAVVLCRNMAEDLNDAVWKLHEDEIASYLDRQPVLGYLLASVSVLTEYNDEILTHVYQPTTDVIRIREPVFHPGEAGPIGFVEITMDRSRVLKYQRFLLRLGIVILTVGGALILASCLLVIQRVFLRPQMAGMDESSESLLSSPKGKDENA